MLRTQARIEAAAALWEQDKRDPSRLLAEGRPLAEAEELFRSRREVLSPHVISFIGRRPPKRDAAGGARARNSVRADLGAREAMVTHAR